MPAILSRKQAKSSSGSGSEAPVVDRRYTVFEFVDGAVVGEPLVVDEPDLIARLAGAAAENGGRCRLLLALTDWSAEQPLEEIYRELLANSGRHWDTQGISTFESRTPIWSPDDLAVPAGALGQLVAVFRRRGRPRKDATPPPLALATWAADEDGVKTIVELLSERFAQRRIYKAQDLAQVFTHLIDRRKIRDRPMTEAASGNGDGVAAVERDRKDEDALDNVGVLVLDWERQFMEGESLTQGEIEQIESILAEGGGQDNASVRFVALERRLVRLLDAQSLRDANGFLQALAAALASLLLVPALVAAIYGANVAVPLAGTSAGWRTMLGFMVAGATLTYIGLASLQLSSTTRRISVTTPGAARLRSVDRTDESWRIRPLFAAACGAAAASLALALSGNETETFVTAGLIQAPTTAAALIALGVAVVGYVLLLAAVDHRQRSWVHAGIDVFVAVSGTILIGAALSNRWAVAVVALLVVAISLSVIFMKRPRRWLRLRYKLADD